MAVMRRVVDGLTAAELDRVCGRKPADPYPDQEYVVRRCLKAVVLKEEAPSSRRSNGSGRRAGPAGGVACLLIAKPVRGLQLGGIAAVGLGCA